jgi:hypothetical protein
LSPLATRGSQILITTDRERTVIRWPWRSGVPMFLMLLVAYWDYTVVNVAREALLGPIDVWSSGGWIATGLVSAAMNYGLAALLVNRTRIVVSAVDIRVASGPLRWWGDRRIDRDDIAGLCLRERNGGKNVKSYAVDVLTCSGERRTLVSSTLTQTDARAVFMRDTLADLLSTKVSPHDA